jgi:hypothetical protein
MLCKRSSPGFLGAGFLNVAKIVISPLCSSDSVIYCTRRNLIKHILNWLLDGTEFGFGYLWNIGLKLCIGLLDTILLNKTEK